MGARKNPKHTEETKKNMRKPHVMSEAGLASLKAFNKGKILSSETRRKMSESRKGHPVSDATRTAISIAHAGRKMSSGQVEKMKQAWIRRKENPPPITPLMKQISQIKQERDQRIVQLFCSGVTQKHIRQELNLSQQAVSRACREAGFRVNSEVRDHSKVLLSKKRYRDKYKEKVQDQYRRWAERNRERIAAQSRAWNTNNLNKRRAISSSYAARRRAVERSTTPIDKKAIPEFFEWIKTADQILCRWCGHQVAVGDREADHIIPLSKGGTHSVDNLCCSCARCNRIKSAKLPDQWAKELSRRSSAQNI